VVFNGTSAVIRQSAVLASKRLAEMIAINLKLYSVK